MVELKECPFCGGKAKLRQGRPYAARKGVRSTFVQCMNCGARSMTLYQYPNKEQQDVENKTAEAWNRRTSEGE